MTIPQTLEAKEAQASRNPSDWSGFAVGFADQIADVKFYRGDLAGLRRMDPDNPDAAAFYRLMASRDLLESGDVLQSKWALILHGIALMTRTSDADVIGRSAHNPNMRVGRALFLGGEQGRTTAFYSENRLNRLLTARGHMQRTLLARLFRMLGSAGQPFNWREMARFILNDGYDEENAERGRRNIASAYYTAESISQRQADQESGD